MRLSQSLIALLFTSVLAACSGAPKKQAVTHATIATPALIRYEYQPGEITRLCTAAIDGTRAKLDAIAKLKPTDRTMDTAMLAFEQAFADFGDTTSPLIFMGYVSTNEALAKEGSACEEKVEQFNVSIFTRKDLYAAIKDLQPRSEDEVRLLSETMEGFELNGAGLTDRKIANRFKELKQKLAALEAQFSANLNADKSTVEFTAQELTGVPDSLLNRLKKTPSGDYIVTTKTTDYIQVMENAIRPDTRKRMQFAYVNRAAKKNTELLKKAIAIRKQIAPLMKFPTWADYRTSQRMAENSKTVMTFLNGLRTKLAERNRQDLEKLLKFKKELDPSAPDAGKLNSWDLAYLSYQLKKRDYSLDDQKIREYFPVNKVIAGMFDMYSKLLGVNFVEVTNAQVWSPDVKMYEVRDSSSGDVLSYFYADFFPRPGKYGHAAAFTLISGRRTPEGYSKPVSSIVANFNPPSGDMPSLMNHSEVETTFHEFGHIMHQTLTRAPYASLAGSGVARDFVEAPSQMLEEWIWQEDLLQSISGHYKTGEKLPSDLLKQMIRARDFNQGYYYTRQLFLALLDMTYHTSKTAVDPDQVHDRLYKEVLSIDPIPGGHFPAGFGHLMGGYDAGYYGYLWSEVYAADMFTLFEKEGLLDRDIGMKYRKTILERGNMADAMDLLRKFLGKEPSNEAFFKKLGVN